MSYNAFIFSKKAHGASQEFAKSIDADFYSVNRYSLYKIFTIKKHKNYLVESVFALTYPVMKKKILRNKCNIIFRCNSNLFSDEPKRYFQGSYFTKKYIKFLLKNVDGIIAVSKMVAEDGRIKCAKEIGREINTRVVYSFMNPSRWTNVKPDLKHRNFLNIGYIRHHKGMDVLLKTFEIIRKKYPESKLFLAGTSQSDLEKYGLRPDDNVIALGYVADMEKYMSQCAFYFATPRYEPGPSASIEAMCAGLVPIVNQFTGHKDHVEQVNKDLIIESSNPNIIAQRVISIMNRKDIEELSEKSIKVAMNYTKDKMLIEFIKAFGDLVND